MTKLLILLILASCSTSTLLPTRSRGIASNTRTPWVEAEFEAGWCLQVDKDKLTSILPEIYLVEEYDRDYYYLTKYVPVENSRDFFENLTYQQIPTEWRQYASTQMGLKAAHAKFQRVRCPKFN